MNRQLVADVERLLSERFGGPTRIVDFTVFASPHVLARCDLHGPRGTPPTVIVKQVTSTEFTSHTSEVSGRLLNEWAGLEFLSVHGGGVAPRLLVGSREQSLVVIEDLGAFPTVIDVAHGSDAADAAGAVAAMGTALGRMQAGASRRDDEFVTIQNRLGATSPHSDSTRRILESAGVVEESLTELGVELDARFWDELDAVERSVHGTGPFQTYVHGDAGPQNCLWTGHEVKLIDFEFGTFGNGLLDVVSARLGFPHSEHASRLPQEVIESLEGRYRSEIAAAVPQAEDDGVFLGALVDVCAHWAIGRWVGLWPRLFSPAALAENQEEGLLARRQAITLFQAFIDVAAETASRRGLATALDSAVEALRSRNEGLEVMPLYPAFDSS